MLSIINFSTAYRKLYKYLDTYSGSQFIKAMQGSDSSLPDYAKYIEIRRKEGKSTIRKDYFKDILFSYPDETRIKMFEIFLKQYEKASPVEAREIRSMLIKEA